MPELIHFQFHQNMALQNTMIEDQIHKPTGVADGDTLLLRLQAESVAQFQKELSQIVHQRRLQVSFRHGIFRPKTEELEDVGITNGEFGFLRFHPFLHHCRQLLLVLRQTGTFEIQRGDLPLQCPHGPIAPDALYLVKGAFQRGINLDKFGEMTKG